MLMMTESAAGAAAASSAGLEIARLAAKSKTRIDSKTGLSTDFLNQYNELVMLLELAADWPDGLADLAGWRPNDYATHFDQSGFTDRDLVVEAYDLAPWTVRQRFDRITAELDMCLKTGLPPLVAECASPSSGFAAAASSLAGEAKRLLADLAATMAGPGDECAVSDGPASQADIDALFD